MIEYHTVKSGGKRSPRQLVNTLGSPPPSSGEMHPDKGEVKQKGQEACMDEKGDPEQTNTKKNPIEGGIKN